LPPAGVARCGGVPGRLPSLTGGDAGSLDEFLPPLPSRERVYQQLFEALGEMEVSRDPVLLLLVAEWGEGKTSVYYAKVRPWLERRGWRGLEARAATVAAHLEALRGRAEKSPGLRLMAAVLAAALEQAGLLQRYGAPGGAESLRGYVERVLRGLVPPGGSLVVFVDELEDLVAGAGEEALGELANGLVGVLNGEVGLVSSRCLEEGGGEGCLSGRFHMVASLTPPAYSRLMGLRDFATVAARLRRRVRSVWIRPLPRREALAVLESLARYSLGRGLDGLLADHGLGNAVVSGTLGNMGALVSAFRYLVGWARGRGGCGAAVKILDAEELLEALQGLTLSVGGTELPALNTEAYGRLREGWLARARLSGVEQGVAARLLDELVARGAAGFEELEEATGASRGVVEAAVGEMNVYAERSWLRRELGLRRLVYRVGLVPLVEDAFKLLRAAEPEIVRTLPQLGGGDRSGRPLEELLDSLVYSDPTGRQVVAVPLGEEDAADLVADASPVELGRGEAERLAQMLWEGVFQKLAPSAATRGLLLSPRVQRLVYVSPELGYLDFIVDRVERLRVVRRVYSSAGPQHLLVGAVAALAAAGLVEEPPAPQGEAAARLVARLPGGGAARVLLVAVPGQVTMEEARRVEGVLAAALLSGWRPHAVLLVHHGGVEPRARAVLENLEAKFFLRVVPAGLQSLVSRVRLQAVGVKLLEAAGGLEAALREAAELPVDRGLVEDRGFDPLRLPQVLRELAEELAARERLRRALEEGVDGAPLVVRDPRLGYDVERPTELSGALRYFLVVPSTKASPGEALRAAYEYVLRYHLYRGAGGEARGIMSPDIDLGEVGALEKYAVLLAANGFLEKLNGSVRVDTLAPVERAALRALEQLNARLGEVPASRLWDILVVEARNPGTKRMILQSLAYRGLVEAATRRLDPERARLRLRDTVEDAAGLIQAARGLLDRLRGDEAALRWGLVVSAKARGYRAGSLEALAGKMEHFLGIAEEALRAGDTLMALRLAKTAHDVLDYALSELVPLAYRAAETVAGLRREAEERAARIRELAETVAGLLEQLLGRRLEVEAPGLGELLEAARRLREVEEAEITEQQLDEAMRRLWAEAKKRNPRKPGEATPFYISRGQLLHFNYRVYLAARALEELGVGGLTERGVELGGKAAETLARLERLAERLRAALEAGAEARRLAERLRERLAGLGAEPPPGLVAVAAGVEPPAGGERLGLLDAEALAEQLRASMEQAWRPLRELEEQLDRLDEERERLAELLQEAKAWASRLREAAREAREAGLAAQAERLAEAAGDLEVAARQAVEAEERALEKLRGGAGDVRGLLEAAREARGLVESAQVLLRDSLDVAKRRHREALEEAGRLLQGMRLEAEALRDLLRRVGVEPPGPPEASTTWAALAAMRAYMEELRRLALERGVLAGEELEAYTLVAQERRRRGELLFREAVALVAESLHLPPEAAKRLLISLIEKGVLEPRL